MKGHYLYTPEWGEWLRIEYGVKKRSLRDLAKEHSVYLSLIRRVLTYHKIPLRTKSEAQKVALVLGRSTNPSEGKPMTEERKKELSETTSAWWASLEESKRKLLKKKMSISYEELGEEKQRELSERAKEGLRRTSREGSELEQHLLAGLRAAGYTVKFHDKWSIGEEKMHVDIVIIDPAGKIAVEVDGPMHFRPVWGSQDLEKRKLRDEKKNGLLISQGYRVIRVRQVCNHLSGIKKKNALTKLLEAVEKGGEGLTQVEVK